jgi:hypothetical protein
MVMVPSSAFDTDTLVTVSARPAEDVDVDVDEEAEPPEAESLESPGPLDLLVPEAAPVLPAPVECDAGWFVGCPVVRPVPECPAEWPRPG